MLSQLDTQIVIESLERALEILKKSIAKESPSSNSDKIEYDPQIDADYLNRYPDVKKAVKSGKIKTGWHHFIRHGRAEGRIYGLIPDEKKSDWILETIQKDIWPAAVNPDLICNAASEEDKFRRADNILDVMIDVELKDRKFLDYGCGEGHVVLRAAEKNSTVAVGYDIKESGKYTWGSNLTTNKEIITQFAPYDAILLYDVIDHSDDPQSILNDVRSLLAPGGTVFVRCHPWYSRHGSHLYHTFNKAFAHLVLMPSELEQLGAVSDMKFYKVKSPDDYRDMFTKSGFKYLENIQMEPIELFLKENIIIDKIKEHTDPANMSHTFIDYTLTVAE